MNEKQVHRGSSIVFTIVFLLLVVVIGLISMGKLIRFYVTDEVDYNEWTADLGSKFETDIATTFFEKYQFVNLNGAIRNILGEREMNGVVKLNNGYLLSPISYASDEHLRYCADRVEAFATYVKAQGKHFVYVTTPYTSAKNDPQLPAGVEDYGNENVDRFLKMLEERQVDTIDLRQEMIEDGINPYTMMYKTDHHWNTYGGFYGFTKLEEYIVQKTGCSVDPKIRDLSNYTLTEYPNWHLGALGQRTGKYFAGMDDFTLILPTFDTKIRNEETGQEGTLEEVVFDKKPLESRDYKNRWTYDHVLQGAEGRFTNPKSRNDIRVLLYGDSFAKAADAYLLLNFREFFFIFNNNLTGVTPEAVDAYDPDVVILLYYPAQLEESKQGLPFAFDHFME